jgi:2-haloacid dehalogenase
MRADDYDTVVFDVGGVLLEWDPRHLYRTLLPSDAEIDAFLGRVPLVEHNYDHNDRGVPIATTVERLCAQFPDDHALITAWGDRLADMVVPLDDAIEVVGELHGRGTRLLLLSNAPIEMAAIMRSYAFCERFDGGVFSGEEGVVKPEPEIFRLLVERFSVEPARAVFVDDKEPNVRAAEAEGFRGVVYESAAQLRAALGLTG